MFGNVWNLISCYKVFFLDGLNRIRTIVKWICGNVAQLEFILNGSCLKLESMKIPFGFGLTNAIGDGYWL